MARPVRRSQRGKRQTYQVGDLVEIVRGDGVAPGQLLHKMDNGNSSSSEPFWLVAFDDGTRDEEICEKSFGPLLQSGSGASTTGNVGGRGGGRRGRNKSTSSVDHLNSSEDTSGSATPANSEEDKESTTANDGGFGGRRKRARGSGETVKKRPRRSGGSSGASNDTETAGDKMSAKEGDDGAANHREGSADADAGSNTVDDYDNDSGVNTRSSARRKKTSGSPLGGGNFPASYKTGRNKKGRNRKGGKRRHQFHQQLYYRTQAEREHDPNETVEKVKFLTGTLFLYRGENPRAAFVRSS